MDTLLKPSRLDLDPNSPTASKHWKHWHRTLTNFIEECGERAPNKFRTLIKYVPLNIFDYNEDFPVYEAVIQMLTWLFVKMPNGIFACHLLASRRQQSGEILSEFLRELHKLSKDCYTKAVSAEEYREELIQDTFTNRLVSPLIQP